MASAPRLYTMSAGSATLTIGGRIGLVQSSPDPGNTAVAHRKTLPPFCEGGTEGGWAPPQVGAQNAGSRALRYGMRCFSVRNALFLPAAIVLERVTRM